MILVVGALSSGKRHYITHTLGYKKAQQANAVFNDCPVLYNLQDLVHCYAGNSLDLLPQLLEKEVIACNEVGCGVIPAQPSYTEWREATGRLCNALAERAEKVVRLVCGIPVVLKE